MIKLRGFRVEITGKNINDFNLMKILDWSPESVFETILPTVAGVEDIIRLQRIMYRALYFLKITRQRSKNALLTAWEDILMLQDWCLQQEMNEAIVAFSEDAEKDGVVLSQYIDRERYTENVKQGIELYYLGVTDVLQEVILQRGTILNTPCEFESADFTNAEFLCVAALYKASMALQKIQRIHNLLLNNTAIDRSILWELKQATNDTLEAQLAIELGNLYDKLSSGDFEAVFKTMLAEQQRQRSLQGNHMRWNKHKLRREKAWELFNQYQQEHPDLTDTKIIAHIVDDIQLFSDEIGIDRLKVGSEVDSIYKMIYQKRTELKDKP
jgi:hypothetical protein